jgi:hypothetical protein
MLNISGSYNINLQLEELSFWNNKINLRIFKIIKHSRIIRSQNAFDAVGGMGGGTALSFDSQDIESNVHEGTPQDGKKATAKKQKGFMFDDLDPIDKDQLDGEGSASHKDDSLFESSAGSSNGTHGQST